MEKRRQEENQEREDQRRRKSKRENAGAQKGGISLQALCFSIEGSKSKLAKAAGVEPVGQLSDQKFDEKLEVVMARNTFWSEMVSKHTRFGALLDVEMSKNCTLLWRQAHLEVKSL